MNTYLHVGHNEVNPLTFRQIQDGQLINNKLSKPRGGLWLTNQEKDNTIGNEWVEFLSWHPNEAIYLHHLQENGTMKCLLVSLKDKAKIFNLDNNEQLNYLIEKYPNEQLFSYEALSKDYDGIYLNIYKFYHLPIFNNYFSKFSVNTLLLFNYDCISYYYPGIIEIKDIDENYEFNNYHIILENEKKEIPPIPLKYVILQEKVKKLLISYIKKAGYTEINISIYAIIYDDLKNLITQNYAKELEILSQENNTSVKRLTLALMDNALINFK